MFLFSCVILFFSSFFFFFSFSSFVSVLLFLSPHVFSSFLIPLLFFLNNFFRIGIHQFTIKISCFQLEKIFCFFFSFFFNFLFNSLQKLTFFQNPSIYYQKSTKTIFPVPLSFLSFSLSLPPLIIFSESESINSQSKITQSNLLCFQIEKDFVINFLY